MNILELLNQLHGVKKEDVEEAFEGAIEAARGEAKGFTTFIFVTDKQTAMCGTGAELLALVTSVISDLGEKGLPKEEVLKAIDLAYMSDEEIKEETKKSAKRSKKNLDKLRKALEILEEEGEDNE